jgi:hypothetical protein
MSFGVDALSGLTEKLKKLIDETQNQYESFIDTNQLYKQGRINEKEFFASIGDYLIATSAMNFLAIRVILEMKSKMDKGTSIKSPTGGIASSSSGSQVGFGIDGFVNAGGNVGSGGDTMPQPLSQQEPKLKPVDIDIKRAFSKQDEKTGGGGGGGKQISSQIGETKNCIVCGVTIPKKAKFCSRCGNSQ